jgi:hypothetical protein
MKKLLLLSLALGLGTMTYAQSPSTQGYKVNNLAPEAITHFDATTFNQVGPINKKQSSKGVISAVTLGHSANVYTMLVEQSNCLTVNEEVGLINFTHRGGASTGTTASGDILHSFSTDGGDTWKTDFLLANASTYANRYPSGAIYNPTGNTNANDAYVVYSGPSHNAGDWNNNYFGSAKFDSTNISNQYIPSQGALVRMGITACTDGKIHVVGPAYTSTPQKFDTCYIYTGTFNSTNNNFDWSVYKIKDSDANFVMNADGSDASYAWHWNSAWSDDGAIGYVWTLGRVVGHDYRSYQPVIWKTTDNGTSWSMQTPFDFTTLTNITDWLQPMKGMTTSRPQFTSAIDGVVDANGELHLMATISAAFSDHNDSLGYSYSVAGVFNNAYFNPIFDVHTTSTGWEAVHLANLYTIAVKAADGGFGSGADAIGWDERIQASRSKDGTKVFAGWADTDTLTAVEVGGLKTNTFPDLFVAALDINTGKTTLPVNFTAGSSFEGACFFHYLSDVVITNTSSYTIPMTKIDIPSGATPVTPIAHDYVKGIEILNSDFQNSGIGFDTKVSNIATVSQNRPNPFNGTTTIDVKLTQSSNVVIEVMNVTGQKVMEMNNGTLSAGNHSFNIDASQLSSGVYFYTVYAGNYSVTKKMIVK